MQKYSGVVQDRAGNVVPNAAITVTYNSGGAAVVYSDNAGTILAQPFSPNTLGEYSFYAADGRYNVNLVFNAATYVIQDLLFSDAAAGLSFTPHGNLTSTTVQSALAEEVDDLAAPSGSSLVGANDANSGSLYTTVQGFITYLLSSFGAIIVGFIQNGTGAVALTVDEELKNVVNVKQFGAKADGSTDDTAAFNYAGTKVRGTEFNTGIVYAPYTASGYALAGTITAYGIEWRGSRALLICSGTAAHFKVVDAVPGLGSTIIKGFVFTSKTATSANTADSILIGALATDTPNGQGDGAFAVYIQSNYWRSYNGHAIHVKRGEGVHINEGNVFTRGVLGNCVLSEGDHVDGLASGNTFTNNLNFAFNRIDHHDSTAQTYWPLQLDGLGVHVHHNELVGNPVGGCWFGATTVNTMAASFDYNFCEQNGLGGHVQFGLASGPYWVNGFTALNNRMEGLGTPLTAQAMNFDCARGGTVTGNMINCGGGEYTNPVMQGNVLSNNILFGPNTYLNSSGGFSVNSSANFLQMNGIVSEPEAIYRTKLSGSASGTSTSTFTLPEDGTFEVTAFADGNGGDGNHPGIASWIVYFRNNGGTNPILKTNVLSAKQVAGIVSDFTCSDPSSTGVLTFTVTQGATNNTYVHVIVKKIGDS